MAMKLRIGIAALLLALSAACYAQVATGAYYFADQRFPQYSHLWQEGWSFKDADGKKLIYAKPDMPLGGYAFVYYKNNTKKPIEVKDLTIGGVKMSEALAQDDRPARAEDKFHATVLMSKLPKAQIDKVMAAGWPAWWKPEPLKVEPGQMGEIIIRMHRNPKPAQLKIGIITSGGVINTTIAVNKAQPQFGTIAFSPDLKTVYIYPRHPKAGTAPSNVMLDGKDITAAATIRFDKASAITPIVLQLSKPLALMSYHNYRVNYPDGSSAQAGIRTWGREMVYGMWSSPGGGGDSKTATETFVADYLKHNVNCVMPYVVGACAGYFNSTEGWAYCEKMGMGRMVHWPGPRDATFLFAMDEPDANDAGFREIDASSRLGAYGQWLVNWTRVLHKSAPNSPVLLNIDNTYKPENWYMYHQLTDIPCVDPYFPEQQDHTYRDAPYYLFAHTRPTYVQGVTTISQSAGQPKPLHVILCSTRYGNDAGYLGRFPTPEEKRMEVYYAVGAGAKGISYWWMAYDQYCRGMAEGTPEAKALWKEIGLLGAEVRTAGPLITSGCPASLPASASDFLWVRTLLSGKDTLAVVVVNENSASDRLGTVVKPCENAQVSIALPSWIEPKEVVEVSCDGLRDLPAKNNKGKLTIDLGTVSVSKFVIVTSNPQIRSMLQKRYDTLFAANVAALQGDGK